MIDEITQHVIEMAFDPGDYPSFVHPERQAWIETGDPVLNELLPTLSKGEQTYLEMIASQTYQDMVRRLETYAGRKAEDIPLPQLLSIVLGCIEDVQAIERENKERFENLALATVLNFDEFAMVKSAYKAGIIEFDVKLAPAELQRTPDTEPEGDLSDAEEINKDLAIAFEDVDERKLKRRLANLLIQGNATLKLYLFNMIRKELKAIDPKLIQKYGLIAVAAQLGYWIYPEGFEQAAAESPELALGSEEILPEGEKYTIKARGVALPYLIHEIVKGIYEWIESETHDKDVDDVDTLEKESEDIMIGPQLARIIASYVPSNKQELIPLVQTKLLKYSREDIKHVLAQDLEGEAIMHEIIADAAKEWAEWEEGEEYEEEEYE
jgi:hypothetical protein